MTEGDKVEVCAVVKSPDIECPINYQFRLRIRTARGSAGIMNGNVFTHKKGRWEES